MNPTRVLAICVLVNTWLPGTGWAQTTSGAGGSPRGDSGGESGSWEERGPLVTDRPAFTGSPLTVYRGHVQVEMGYTLSRVDGSTQNSLGEVVVRIGVAERFEARVGLNSFAWVVAPDNDPSGLEDASLGARVRLLEAKPGSAVPDLGLTVTASLPTGSAEVGQGVGVQPITVLAASLDLTGWLSAGSNLGWGYLDDGTGRYSQFSASLALGFSITRVVGAYVEYFGLFPELDNGSSGNFLNGGFTFLISRDVQADARTGFSIGDAETDFFAGVGLAFRV